MVFQLNYSSVMIPLFQCFALFFLIGRIVGLLFLKEMRHSKIIALYKNNCKKRDCTKDGKVLLFVILLERSLLELSLCYLAYNLWK